MAEKNTVDFEEKECGSGELWCGVDKCRCEGSCRKKHIVSDADIVHCNEVISFYDANPNLKPKREFVRRGYAKD